MIPETVMFIAVAGFPVAGALCGVLGFLLQREGVKTRRLTVALREAQDALAPFAGAAHVRSWRYYHGVFLLAATAPHAIVLPSIDLAPLTVADLWKTADAHLAARQALGEKIVVSPVKILEGTAPSFIVDNAED